MNISDIQNFNNDLIASVNRHSVNHYFALNPENWQDVQSGFTEIDAKVIAGVADGMTIEELDAYSEEWEKDGARVLVFGKLGKRKGSPVGN